MILTTTIGSFPKSSFLTLSDWFKGEKGTDNERSLKIFKQLTFQVHKNLN